MTDDKKLIITNITLSDKIYHGNELILSYKIDYPVFKSEFYPKAAYYLSTHCYAHAEMIRQHCFGYLYEAALKQYKYSVSKGYPFMAYEVIVTYTVTFNHNCILSLYKDRYIYSGGAHGNTVRVSDTWNLFPPTRLTMDVLFPGKVNYKDYVIGQITDQVRQEMKETDAPYFENYEDNIKNTFNESSFYLTDDGMAVYFQQYDIAPYSAGMPVFIIPYAHNGPVLPDCKK